NVIKLLIKGGWIMVPIAILFFLGLVIFVERYITIRKATKLDSNLLPQVKSNIMAGKLDSALTVCRSSASALGRMLEKGLLRVGRPRSEERRVGKECRGRGGGEDEIEGEKLVGERGLELGD